MKPHFLLSRTKIDDRHIEPEFGLTICAKHEELMITLKFIGSGDTTKIANGYIIEKVMKQFKKIE